MNQSKERVLTVITAGRYMVNLQHDKQFEENP
jgi:hypothetical protein